MKRVYTRETLSVIAPGLIIVPFVQNGENVAVKAIRTFFENRKASGLQLKNFEGEALSHLFMEADGGKHVLVMGLGKTPDSAIWRNAFAKCIKIASQKNFSSCAIYFDRMAEPHVSACVEGATFAMYRFNRYKSDPAPPVVTQLKLGTVQKNPNHNAAGKMVKAAVVKADAVMECRDLVNEPANRLGVTEMVEYARNLARKNGLQCKVISGKMLERKKFGLIFAVGKGAAVPPALVELTYTPEKIKGGKRIALIGKGVVFDSGGLCLKPGASMLNMKTDMAGAAVVLSAMGALSALNISHTVTAYIPLAENAVGNDCIRPGDVVRGYSGKTVEIVNTDAEGRLLLADALALAATKNHDEIVDFATLTGACAIALGKNRGAIFSGNSDFQQKWINCAREMGEPIWPLPLAEELEKDVKGDVADLKNSGDRFGGTILAALFLKQFVNPAHWVHFDIAGPARNGSTNRLCPKGGTGFMVLTLLHYLQSN